LSVFKDYNKALNIITSLNQFIISFTGSPYEVFVCTKFPERSGRLAGHLLKLMRKMGNTAEI